MVYMGRYMPFLVRDEKTLNPLSTFFPLSLGKFQKFCSTASENNIIISDNPSSRPYIVNLTATNQPFSKQSFSKSL